MATIAVEAETNGHKQIARFEKKLNIPDVRQQCHSVMSLVRRSLCVIMVVVSLSSFVHIV